MAIDIEKILEEAWQLTAGLQVPAAKSSSFMDLADIYLKSGNKARGIEALELALKAADSVKYPDEKAKLLAGIAKIYGRAGESEKAAAEFKRAFLLSRAAETGNQKAGALYRIAAEQIEVGIKDGLEDVISLLYETAIDPESGVDTAEELIDVADLYLGTGQESRAVPVLEEALEIIEALNDPWFKAEHLLSLAELYIESGDTEKPVQLIHRSIAELDQISEASRSYLLTCAADLYMSLDMKKEAMNALESSLALLAYEEIPHSRINTIVSISASFFELGESVKARELATQAVIDSEANETITGKVNNLNNIAAQLFKIDQISQAGELTSRILSLQEKISDPQTRIMESGRTAILLFKIKNSDQALRTIEIIMQIAQNRNIKEGGLAVIAKELAEIGETALSLKLAHLIREPGLQAFTLAGIVRRVLNNSRDPGEDL